MLTALVDELLENGCANFETMSSGNINSGDLIGALIAQRDSFVEGIRYAQSKIEGTMSLHNHHKGQYNSSP